VDIVDIDSEDIEILPKRDPWQYRLEKRRTRWQPTVWAVLVKEERIGYVVKIAKELYSAGTPYEKSSIYQTRKEAARWLYQKWESDRNERGGEKATQEKGTMATPS
jgi:hypothetical protein